MPRRYQFELCCQPERLTQICGIAFLADCHGFVKHCTEPTVFRADLCALMELYHDFAFDLAEFGERTGLRTVVELVGLGDIVSTKSPLCWASSGAELLLRTLRRLGMKTSVIGNHETLYGPKWIASALGLGTRRQIPQYGSDNVLIGGQRIDRPRIIDLDTIWLTTTETASDLSGSDQVPDWLDVEDPEQFRQAPADAFFAHCGWVSVPSNVPIVDHDLELMDMAREEAAKTPHASLVLDAHSHELIPPDGHFFADDEPLLLSAGQNSTKIGFVLFGIGHNGEFVGSCVKETIAQSSNFFGSSTASFPQRPDMLRELLAPDEPADNERAANPGDDDETVWDDVLGLERENTTRLVRRRIKGLGDDPTTNRRLLAAYAAKCAYKYARRQYSGAVPDAVVMNHGCVRSHAVDAPPGSPDDTVGDLSACYQAGALVALTVELTPPVRSWLIHRIASLLGINRSVERNYKEVLGANAASCECYPHPSRLVLQERHQLTLWLPTYLRRSLASEVQRLTRYIETPTISTLVAMDQMS